MKWAVYAWATIQKHRCSINGMQFHNAPNVFVTDGACMTSTSTQNPSLTYMAITARAANFAVDEMKKGNFPF